MAGQTVGSLLVRIGADIQSLQKGLDKAERQMMRFSNRMQNIGTQLSATVTLPIAAMGAGALKAAANYETLRVSFQTLTKDVAKGNKLFEDLVKFSEKTPFQLNEVAEAAKTMLAYGRSIEQAMSDLGYLGDVAAATGGDLQGLTVIMGQGAALGKFMTVDLKQLAMRGIPILQALGQQLGVTEAQVLEMAGKSQISFQMVETAIKNMTQNGGIYYQAMDKQSKTLAGLFSTLQDSATSAFAQIGDSIKETFQLDTVVAKLTDRIKAAADWFSNLSEGQKRFIVITASVVAAIGPLLVGISTIVKLGATAVTGFKALLGVFSLLTSPIGLIVAGIAALAAGLIYAYKHSEKFRATMNGLGAVVSEVIKIFGEAVKAFLQGFQQLGEGEFRKAAQSFQEAMIKGNPVSMAFAQGGRISKAYSDAYANTIDKAAEEGKFDPYKDKQKIIADAMNAGQTAGQSFAIGVQSGASNELKNFKGIGDASKTTDEFYTGGKRDLTAKGQTPSIAGNLQGALDALKNGQPVMQTWMDNFDRLGDKVTDFASKWGESFRTLGNLVQQFFDNKAAAIDADYERQQKAINGSRMSEEAKQAALQRLEDETDKKRKKLARQQAIRDKILGIIQATIATARAVAQSLPNIPLSIIAGAMGAAQIALIASQKIPALAKGGLAYGPQMAMVGDNPGARVDPEVIAPLSKLQSYMGGAQEVVVRGRIDGRDILLVQERAKQDRLRTRGF